MRLLMITKKYQFDRIRKRSSAINILRSVYAAPYLIKFLRLKSSKKRNLMVHYILYRRFLKYLKINMSINIYRLKVQSFKFNNISLPAALLFKRMYNYNTIFFNQLKSVGGDYVWKNGFNNKIIHNSKFFFKIASYPVKMGVSIFSPIVNIEFEEEKKVLLIEKKVNFNFNAINFYFSFNLSLICIIELYKILIFLHFVNYLNN